MGASPALKRGASDYRPQAGWGVGEGRAFVTQVSPEEGRTWGTQPMDGRTWGTE